MLYAVGFSFMDLVTSYGRGEGVRERRDKNL